MHRLFISLVVGILALLTFVACQKSTPTPASAEAMIFGSYYSECLGERCIEMYRLDPKKQALDEDALDKYPSFTAPYDGNYQARSHADYQRTLPLCQQVPAQLLAVTNGVIGQPDAGDWGGYYVEVNENGTRRFWLIDTQKSHIPPYLHAFTDSLRMHIQALK